MPEKECGQKFECGIEEVKIALFGDGTEENIGIDKMVREMHKVFTRTKWTTKVVIGFFAGIGVITGGIIGVWEVLKRLK